MKINTKYPINITTEHKAYSEFDRKQIIVDDMQVGEQIKIVGVAIDGTETIHAIFTAKYINCHINCQWQDKGTKQEIQP